MVHGVAQQSGGRLVLKSEKGRGTTAELWLPCAPAAVPAAPTPPAPAARPGVRPLAVMVVDDDSLVLHSTAAMLEDLGHRVFQATSGKQALSLLAQHPEVEVLITDHAMPSMTGAELATAVKTNFAFPAGCDCNRLRGTAARLGRRSPASRQAVHAAGTRRRHFANIPGT